MFIDVFLVSESLGGISLGTPLSNNKEQEQNLMVLSSLFLCIYICIYMYIYIYICVYMITYCGNAAKGDYMMFSVSKVSYDFILLWAKEYSELWLWQMGRSRRCLQTNRNQQVWTFISSGYTTSDTPGEKATSWDIIWHFHQKWMKSSHSWLKPRCSQLHTGWGPPVISWFINHCNHH